MLHNEELNDLYCSPNVVRVIKWRRMRWAGHVARMGEERGVYRVLVGKQEGKIYRTIILPVVLYGCDTWSLTLREEKKLRVFEDMVLDLGGTR